jgi:predicted phage baseplate assembly protein
MACTGTSTCTCGCCAGISQGTPAVVENRPGLPAIAYRTGTWSQFRDTLLARLSLSGQPQLRGLRTRENDDFTISLLDSFSVMADGLTFYTERYANESYLRTATEQYSVAQFAALVGYRPSPGVAASTELAFTLDPASGAFGPALSGPLLPGGGVGQMPADALKAVPIPTGTRVQSVPATPNELPQNFETVIDIQGRAAWNAISPRLLQPQQVIDDLPSDVTTLILSGAVTSLKPGDRILILKNSSDSNFNELRLVQKVTIAADSKTTQLDLDGAVSGTTGYNPTTEQPPGASAPVGSVADITTTTLDDTAISQVLSYQWDSATLAVLAQTKKWPIEQLEAAINQSVASRALSEGGGAWVMRQQAAGFGFNLPLLETPPFSPPPTFDPLGNATLGYWSGPIYLDAVYPQIVNGSFLVIQSDTGDSGPLAVQVTSVSTVTHFDFKATAKVTVVRTDASTSALNQYPIRSSSILCQSDALPLGPVPITDEIPGSADNTITLDQAYLSLAAGQRVVLSGLRTDLPGTSASEIQTLETVTLQGGFTVIKLKEGLQHRYQRSSVKINANVADATHGASVAEVLGNGDGAQSFQSFVLKQSPLTYVRADTPSGITSTLKIYVDAQLWTEVPYFYGHGASEHIYITSQGDKGVTTVTFGDGITGSRLPTGTANVTAAYRYGIGTAGFVDANQISLLTNRPLGVRAATNPLPSTDAADMESLTDSRTNATLTIMTLDRIVSVEDYEDFARAYTGISKALAVWIWSGEQRMLLLTVAGHKGAIPDTTALGRSIANASEPGVLVRIQSFSPAFFRLAGSVTMLPDRIPGNVQNDLENALRTAFGFDARSFGQGVNLSSVIAVIQDVSGVQDVELTALYRSDDPSPGSLHQYLPAQAPEPGARQITPAELLTLDPAPLFPDLEVTL